MIEEAACFAPSTNSLPVGKGNMSALWASDAFIETLTPTVGALPKGRVQDISALGALPRRYRSGY